MLATSALTTAHQAVDASAKRFKQAGAYRSLHMHLTRQSFRHVGDDEAMVDVHNLLHCQLQAGGRPSSPNSDDQRPPCDLGDLLVQFNDAPVHNHHIETFIQDGGDDDKYYK